jgi:hypothetical protein
MSLFLNNAHFEHACREAGITDLERDGDGYANPATQATYKVWSSVAVPMAGHSSTPLGWAAIRGGKVQGIVSTRPTGPESPDWPRMRTQGWEPARPVFLGVPSVSPVVMDVLLELQRQRQEEGYTVEKDQEYESGQLMRGAACYALQAAGVYPMRYAGFWPFKSKIKTCPAPESAIKSVAMMLADMERAGAQRAAQTAQ